MSVEDDFHAVLVGNAGLVALVGTGIAQHAVDQRQALPIVVFAADVNREHTLAGSVLDERTTFTVDCWAQTADQAGDVADAVEAALDAFDESQTSVCVTVLSRTTVYDGELKLDGVTLSVEWWP